ncbi:hypothetical protein BDP81DRAFT_206229 [Colletotrichum phormii]|uniref:Uncharacterized protein n=1 Tax=Colletotrichum phormii TaxID=359342 RepID=A0AAI9ZUY9_9PEZI|nr:uncharacterized protein BDP81DRAFT_206229 [Colletotrichum phormii]KAK1638325.1 hypothetical protein BDP81DRAFT_206229 [Colletotrichum phormii]
MDDGCDDMPSRKNAQHRQTSTPETSPARHSFSFDTSSEPLPSLLSASLDPSLLGHIHTSTHCRRTDIVDTLRPMQRLLRPLTYLHLANCTSVGLRPPCVLCRVASAWFTGNELLVGTQKKVAVVYPDGRFISKSSTAATTNGALEEGPVLLLIYIIANPPAPRSTRGPRRTPTHQL